MNRASALLLVFVLFISGVGLFIWANADAVSDKNMTEANTATVLPETWETSDVITERNVARSFVPFPIMDNPLIKFNDIEELKKKAEEEKQEEEAALDVYIIPKERVNELIEEMEARKKAEEEARIAEERRKAERIAAQKAAVEAAQRARATGSYSVPSVPDFKSWTNYVDNVSRSSPQWRILTQENAWTDENGFRRIGSDYMVAIGSYYSTHLGDRFYVTTTNGGYSITICDFKPDSITDVTHRYTTANNCITEFYVDGNLANCVRSSGSCSSIPELSGKITGIVKIG